MREALEDSKPLLLDEAPNEERDGRVFGQLQAGSRRGDFSRVLRRTKNRGVDAVEDEARRPLEVERGEPSSRRLADEHDLIGALQEGPDDESIGDAHQRGEERIAIGHEADVLDDDEGLAIGARGDEGRNARHVDCVVNEDDVALPCRFENSTQCGRREQGIGQRCDPL